LKVIPYNKTLDKAWADFVSTSPGASNYHQIGWKSVVEESFGHQTHYLMVMNDQDVVGVFPLVMVDSFLFGKYLVSLPFVNYGGICTANDHARQMLLDKAIEIAKQEGAKHIELRETTELNYGLPSKTGKVSMLLDLPADAEQLWKAFKPKLRSQIRRPQKEGMKAVIGGTEELDSFYRVFSENMRDLGTPVYSKCFFKNILETFGGSSVICSVYHEGRPVAAAFLTGYNGILEIPWASALRSHNHLSPNMLLYWKVLEHACNHGYQTFDFGRSTPDTGTFRFKKQWGASPLQHHWYYWLPEGGELPELNPRNPKYELAINIWRKLPLWLTKIIGPHIVKGLP